MGSTTQDSNLPGPGAGYGMTEFWRGWYLLHRLPMEANVRDTSHMSDMARAPHGDVTSCQHVCSAWG